MEQNDNNHVSDLELVMLYNKHIKYCEALETGEKTLFDTAVNTKMINTMKKRRDTIKARYVGPKYDRIVSHVNKRINNSTSRRVNY